MIRPFLPQDSSGPQRSAGPSTSCPSPKRLTNSHSVGPLEETRNRGAELKPQLLVRSRPPTCEEEMATLGSTYWLLPAKRCGSLPLPGSCGRHKRRNPRPACSGVRGRCVERRGSRWAAACAANGDYRGPFPPVRHLCTTPQSGLAGPPPYS